MIDINSQQFINEPLDPSTAVVGVLGHGYVGSAVEQFFSWRLDEFDDPQKLFDVRVYDPAKPELDSFERVVQDSSVIFICVPTPMNKSDGTCYTGIVTEAVVRIIEECAKQGRDLNDLVLVIKSTVPPGYTRSIRNIYGVRIVFSPEFLTEANSVNDFEYTNRIVLGGPEEDAIVVYKFIQAKLDERLKFGSCVVINTSDETAEVVKLFTNGILFTKVMFCNEIYKICESLKISYDEVLDVALFDRRIGPSHTRVPGPDGDFGAGGHCFIKDMYDLVNVSKQLGTGEKMFTACLSRNDEIRTNRNWEKMEGRAVIDLSKRDV